MPGLVGGFGKITKYSFSYYIFSKKFYFLINKNFNYFFKLKLNKLNLITKNYNTITKLNENNTIYNSTINNYNINYSNLGPYLAGLIEGDGTIAIHDPNNQNNKYNPKIIIIFKKSDLKLATFLQIITKSGIILNKPERGYILWQIQDIESIYNIINLINGYIRTPKIEAVHRTIDWFNNYILKNKNSHLIITQKILSKITILEKKPLDFSSIDSNSWFSGFSDADGNFSINIHKRTNRNSTRVQLFYRLEIRQNYHRLDSANNNLNYFNIMSKIGLFLGVTVYSRSRIIKDKIFYSFIIMTHNKISNLKVCEYFYNFPLLSSKYLDYKDWKDILELQNNNLNTTSYLDKAINMRKDFNSTRTTYVWNHLNNCYFFVKRNKE